MEPIGNTPVVMALPTTPVKLDLGDGVVAREGFKRADFNAIERARAWPLGDSSVDELAATHLVERIPAGNVRRRRRPEDRLGREPGLSLQDRFLAFFDEAFRVLKPGGTFTLVVASATSLRGFADPRARRQLVQETFLFLSAEWRRVQKIPDADSCACDFGVSSTPFVDPEHNAKCPEVQAARFAHFWNVCLGFQVVLKSHKPAK
jgi:hypothetical protein